MFQERWLARQNFSDEFFDKTGVRKSTALFGNQNMLSKN